MEVKEQRWQFFLLVLFFSCLLLHWEVVEKEGSFMDHPMINQAVDKAKRYVKSFEKSEMIQATAKRNTTKIEL